MDLEKTIITIMGFVAIFFLISIMFAIFEHPLALVFLIIVVVGIIGTVILFLLNVWGFIKY